MTTRRRTTPVGERTLAKAEPWKNRDGNAIYVTVTDPRLKTPDNPSGSVVLYVSASLPHSVVYSRLSLLFPEDG